MAKQRKTFMKVTRSEEVLVRTLRQMRKDMQYDVETDYMGLVLTAVTVYPQTIRPGSEGLDRIAIQSGHRVLTETQASPVREASMLQTLADVTEGWVLPELRKMVEAHVSKHDLPMPRPAVRDGELKDGLVSKEVMVARAEAEREGGPRH